MFVRLVPKIYRTVVCSYFSQKSVQPLRSIKPKSVRDSVQYFVDVKNVRTVGGKGGNGCISFLSLWANENAGPDGGDGGNGAHVIFQADQQTKDLSHITRLVKGDDGEKGFNKDCDGKSAKHNILKVPIGTVIKKSNGKVVADLKSEGAMFIAARGGAGGRGNHFFITDTVQAPEICEFGAEGEDLEYIIEMRCMAHIGLIGFPNAGKSTLLRAISRARPKVAPYPFTTLKPHIGMVQYDDYEQIAVADLPGLIPDSHKNKGLGIQFLKHVQRCVAIMYILDVSIEPWEHLKILRHELSQFSPSLLNRNQLIIANKMDLPEAIKNLEFLKSKTDLPVIPVSAKVGTNLRLLLNEIRLLYDKNNEVQNT